MVGYTLLPRKADINGMSGRGSGILFFFYLTCRGQFKWLAAGFAGLAFLLFTDGVSTYFETAEVCLSSAARNLSKSSIVYNYSQPETFHYYL